MATADRDEKVDRLLHDADRAKCGADFAAMMRDKRSEDELAAKAKRLRAEAEALDPAHEAPAWRWVDWVKM